MVKREKKSPAQGSVPAEGRNKNSIGNIKLSRLVHLSTNTAMDIWRRNRGRKVIWTDKK